MKMDNRGIGLWTLDFGLWTPSHKNRPAIPHPTSICWMKHEFDSSQIASRPFQITTRQFFFGLVLDEQPDDFASRNFADHFTINPTNGIQLHRPIRRIMRPAHPCRFLGLPLA